MIQPIEFMDTWGFSAALFAKYKDRFNGDIVGVLPLRNASGPLPILAEFRSAKALLSRVRAAAAPAFGGRTPELGEAHVVRLDPGGIVPWSADEAKGPHAHICIVPAPSAWVYCNGLSAVLPVGQLTLVDHRLPWSAANFGTHAAVHLVVELYLEDQLDAAADASE